MQAYDPNGITEKVYAQLEKQLGKPTATDGYRALYDSKNQDEALAAAKRGPQTSLHKEGEEITMKDGTKYRVSSTGAWIKT